MMIKIKNIRIIIILKTDSLHFLIHHAFSYTCNVIFLNPDYYNKKYGTL